MRFAMALRSFPRVDRFVDELLELREALTVPAAAERASLPAAALAEAALGLGRIVEHETIRLVLALQEPRADDAAASLLCDSMHDPLARLVAAA